MKKILCALLLITVFVFGFASCNEAQAPQITISDDGYWVINGEKTGVKAQGEKGDKGDQGEQGIQGEKGEDATATDENPLGLAFFLKDDGTYAVEIGQAKYLSKIEIPAIYKGKAVTEVGSFGSEILKEITIPNSVTSIDSYAFYRCTALTSVTIGDSVTSIGDSAFSNCSALTSVTIPDSVTSIGRNVFYGCEALTSVAIPDSVTSIGHAAFADCFDLASVTIGDSVTTIGNFAFSDCTNLTSVTIGDSVTTIGNYAFEDCTSLTSVTFVNPNGWWRTQDANATSGTDLSASDLSNPSTAAQYLTTNYAWNYWYRTE